MELHSYSSGNFIAIVIAPGSLKKALKSHIRAVSQTFLTVLKHFQQFKNFGWFLILSFREFQWERFTTLLWKFTPIFLKICSWLHRLFFFLIFDLQISIQLISTHNANRNDTNILLLFIEKKKFSWRYFTENWLVYQLDLLFSHSNVNYFWHCNENGEWPITIIELPSNWNMRKVYECVLISYTLRV